MNEKPEAKPCGGCGELIEPYLDDGRWVYSGYGCVVVNDEVYHNDCFNHLKLWRRIRAIEKSLGIQQ